MNTANANDQVPALERLASFACETTLGSVPEVVRVQARLCILDTLGCIIAGTRTEECELILECEADEGAVSTVVIPGTAHRRSLLAAIRTNGYLGDVLELNDLIGGHASIGNVTASVALAESLHASGRALVEAVICGIEVTGRVYSAVYPTLKRFTEMGLVPVGIPSTIGAAAAAARLLQLDRGQTLHAMAIAGTLAGWCPAEVVFGNGGTVKPMLFGAQPGATGVAAALRARRGMKGPVNLLDSKFGYFATVSNGGRLPDEPLPWFLARPRRKLHACCGYLHAAVDAMGHLRAELGQATADGWITVRVPPYVADVVNKSGPPVSANDARFHLQYCVALAACGHEVLKPEHSIEFRSFFGRSDVAAAVAKVRVVPDPALTHYHQCNVVVDLGGSRVHERSVSAPRGTPGAPLTDADVVEKFVSLASPVLGYSRAAEFAAAVDRLEDAADIGALMSRLAAHS